MKPQVHICNCSSMHLYNTRLYFVKLFKKMFELTLLFVAIFSKCEAEVFHVTPRHPAILPCPPPCYTLNQYAQNTSLLARHTNISLIFLEGVHNLSYELTITEPDEITLQAKPGLPSAVSVRSNNQQILLSGQRIILQKLIIYSTKITVGNDNGVILPVLHLAIRECELLYGVVLIHTHLINEVLVEAVNSNLQGGNGADDGIIVLSRDDTNYTIKVHNSSITEYSGRGLDINSGAKSLSVIITDSMISENSLGVYITEVKSLKIDNSVISRSDNGLLMHNLSSGNITNSRFDDNEIAIILINSDVTLASVYINSSNDFGVVLLGASQSTLDTNSTHMVDYNEKKVSFIDCSFFDNSGSSILAYQSLFELCGDTMFYDNMAERGAGLALYNSTVHFGFGSNITFTNNTAKEYGGAIYISSLLPKVLPSILTRTETENKATGVPGFTKTSIFNQQCFYTSDEQAKVAFTDNNAQIGGMDIFGANAISYLQQCSITQSNVFTFNLSIPTTLLVASAPTRVCFCENNVPQCENKEYLILNETRYPGESFTVPVVLVGFNFGSVAGIVYANALSSQMEVISDSLVSQLIHSGRYKKCTHLKYSISSDTTNSSVILALTARQKFSFDNKQNEVETSLREIYSMECRQSTPVPCTALLYSPVYINITLEACPLGFELNRSSGQCDCKRNLAGIRYNDQMALTCLIRNRTGYITRGGTVWVGVDINNYQTDHDVFYWHRYCPNDYCNSTQASIDLRSPDKQCSSNRAGVLCGRCQASYSLQLGGNKCLKCNNSYLALLIVFAVLGVLLVVLIKLLDLTVTSGTVNGLIFYANIVWRNNAILFPLQTVNEENIVYYIVTVPIAWMNLDFGIETCFSENLDQLTKTGLQFVFPVYIWCIAIVIIIISHYSTRATKLFGSNSVSVLSTLFLLSYVKLFRNITDVFAYADLTDSDGKIHKVWSHDGNVPYGGTPSHIVLMIVALFFLVLILLPFTLTLLLVPFLRAKSHLRPLHWINTLKPFFDTYYGPFKDKRRHQVWTGILLLSRMVVLIVFASSSTYNPNASIFLMTLIAVLLLLYSAFADLLYKKLYLSLLEMLYLFNLTILGAAFLFYQTIPHEDRQSHQLNPVAGFSVCIALFQFVCTLVFHIAMKIKSKGTHWTQHYTVVESVNLGGVSDESEKHSLPSTTVTTQVVEIPNRMVYNPSSLRESLLD